MMSVADMAEDVTEAELKAAAADFMRNLSENAARPKMSADVQDIGLEYFKSICNGDFDGQLYYGTAYGQEFVVPDEYK